MKKKHLVLLLMVFVVLAFIVVGCRTEQAPTPTPTPPEQGQTPAPGAVNYVGSDTCKSCHSGKHEDFSKTGHATTFKPLSAYNISDLPQQITIFDADNKENPASATIDLTKAYGVMVDDYVIAPVPETAGFKSNVYRVAAVHKEGDKWSLAPAREEDFNKDGKKDWGGSSYSCSNCHSPGLEHGSQELTIGCESCHGPGGAHVTAQNKKGTMTISQDACISCHESNPKKNKDGVYETTNHYGTRNYFASKHAESSQLNNCLACHTSHKANANGKLLVADKSEDICAQCHTQKFDIDKIMWKNPTDPYNHIHRDHSFGAMPYDKLGDKKDTKPVEITNPDMVKIIEDKLEGE